MHTVESSVVAVTVYRAGALVTREATIANTGDGYPQHVQLSGLPLTLDDASIRIEVDTEAGAPPVAGDVRVTVALPEQDDALPPPDDLELEEARLQRDTARRALADRRAALQRLAGLEIRGRGEPEEGKPPARSPTTARMHLLELRRRREAALHSAIAEAAEHERRAHEQLEALRERRRVASDSRNTRTYELRKAAVVRLDRSPDQSDETPSSARLRIRYFVAGARWAPAYTVRLGRTMESGQIQVRAVLRQKTGEDWRNVALTLSTARPQHWTELPEMKAIRIGRRQAEPAKTGWRPPPVGAESLYSDYDAGCPKPPVPKETPARPQRTKARRSEPVPEPMLGDLLQADGAVARNMAPPPQSHPAPPPSAPPPPGAAAPRPSAAPASMGAAPIAAQQSIAAPAPEMAKRARASGIGTLVGGVLSEAAAGATALFGSGGGDDDLALDDDDFEVEKGIVAGRDLLDYGALQLHPADHAMRGRLQRVESRVLYERWVSESVVTSVIGQRLASAQRDAHALEQSAAPTGHAWIDEDHDYDYAYVADAPVDVPSDGKTTSLSVMSCDAETTPRYISVPRETQDVFRIVAIRNPLDAPLLRGPADVYVDGKFALTSTMEVTPPSGRFELGLGVEQAIKISRNVDFEEDTSGLIKRSHDLVHTIRIDINNNLPRPARVEVRERIGVKVEGDDDVEIVERSSEPPWDDYEQRSLERLEGGRVWKVDVPAGEARKLRATWSVRIPSQHELVGGNRRDR